MRALEPFAKGTLTLTPPCGKMLAADSEEAVAMVQDRDVIHKSMLSYCTVDVRCGILDKRHKGRDAQKQKKGFNLFSPLHAGKPIKERDSCLHNLHP